MRFLHFYEADWGWERAVYLPLGFTKDKLTKQTLVCVNEWVKRRATIYLGLIPPTAFPTDYELNWTEAYQAKLTWKAVNDNTVRGYNVSAY